MPENEPDPYLFGDQRNKDEKAQSSENPWKDWTQMVESQSAQKKLEERNDEEEYSDHEDTSELLKAAEKTAAQAKAAEKMAAQELGKSTKTNSVKEEKAYSYYTSIPLTNPVKDVIEDEAQEFDAATSGALPAYLGRIRLISCFGSTAFIGPHWCFSLIMFAVINTVGIAYTAGVASYVSAFQTGLGVLVTSASTLSFLSCALADPGILVPTPGAPGGNCIPEQWFPSTGNRPCSACNIAQPLGTLHCEYCHVCIAGYDHHCPWMGKCIGYKNLPQFYVFLIVSLASLGYIVLVTLLTA
eukprot:TRINITY_DN10042_c0_g1_i6.p1 TRINITY_DN10042_c0_g1~~TRINITY_DN10042_c0_g1_i6.p1  ORF type:complete len:299 (+),score=40.76 TRINITY_DN10042_c0_g1_i6:46-942(+)